MKITDRVILSLCDYSGSWSQPYVDAGYKVIRVDLGHEPGEHRISKNLTHVGADITRWDIAFHPWGILAAPPCTTFCRPGARWPRQDERGETASNMLIWRECLRICKMAKTWWGLENPPGRHIKLMPEIGRPAWQFQPWQYGDPWVKQTYIWGTAAKPAPTDIVEPEPTYRTPNGRTQGRIARMSSSWKREREKTPEGFAKAFFTANS